MKPISISDALSRDEGNIASAREQPPAEAAANGTRAVTTDFRRGMLGDSLVDIAGVQTVKPAQQPRPRKRTRADTSRHLRDLLLDAVDYRLRNRQ